MNAVATMLSIKKDEIAITPILVASIKKNLSGKLF